MSTRSRFIFSIWSDIERWQTHTCKDLIADFKDEGKLGSGITGQALIRKLGGLVYCFDDTSHKAATALGLDTVRMPDDSYAHEPGHYCRKLLSIQHALNTYDEVCHLDLDVVLVRPLPGDFWEQLRTGAPLQAPLMLHRRRKATWRTDPEAQRYWVNACYVYCRSECIAASCVQLMRANPEWFEEGILGCAIDYGGGGWQGADSYRERGFNPPGIWQLKGCFNSENPWFVHNNRK